jgi:thiol-disulfide isomerase/thioredoxin
MIVTAGGALALGAGVAWWRASDRQAASTDADPLFALTFADADGRSQPLAQWRGLLLVVNFWATWCAPCVEEMPALDRARAIYRNRGVEVIGIGIDDAARIRAFRDRLGIGLPLLVAGMGGSELARSLGNASGVLPYTVLVAPSGAIWQRRIGQVQPDELKSWLDDGLRRSRPPA